jgi:hypothetical protein
MNSPKCARCDRPATVHETLVENGIVTERHYCRRHGQPVWFHACHGPLVQAVVGLTDEQLPAGVSREELSRRMAEARSFSAARKALRSQ